MAHSYTDKGEKPEVGEYYGFDHVALWCGNAKQSADWYVARFGFKRVAYQGLETAVRNDKVVSHVIRRNDVTLVLRSCLQPDDPDGIGAHIAKHGDGVRDVAFRVNDCRGIFAAAVERGAKVVEEPHEIKDDDGSVWLATIQTYGDTTHTFVERSGYKGVFLPGYVSVDVEDPLETLTEPVKLDFIDHVVGNQPDGEMTPAADWYTTVLQFHRFWSVDDSVLHTEYSALRSIVVCDYDERVKMPINEPANGKKKSQIQEYVEFYGGAGAQHIAINTSDIIDSITKLRARGLEFLSVPDSYYDQLRAKLAKSPVKVTEDMDTLQKLNILIDYDDNGYLLQLFTKPVEDRPTLFYEIIQRHNHTGFGAGNFKALFEAIEREQEIRGNL